MNHRVETPQIVDAYVADVHVEARDFLRGPAQIAVREQAVVQPDDFVPRYLRVLAHGGAKSPEFILTEAGLDMTSPAFWQGGYRVIDEMIDELEELV